MIAGILTALLLLGNALFVGSEFALIASRRTALEPQAATSFRARCALSSIDQLPLMIAGVQLGITICSLGLGAVAEPAIAHALEPVFTAAGLSPAVIHPISLAIALSFVVYLHTVLGEMVPKNLALAGPEKSALWLGPFMLGFCTIVKPLLIAMTAASGWILARAGVRTSASTETVYNASEFAGLVSQSRTHGLIGGSDHERLTGALALQQRTAKDVLRPWGSVITVPDSISPRSLELLAHRAGLSRFPVIARRNRRVLGFVHIKDNLCATDSARRSPIRTGSIRAIPHVKASDTLAELLIRMRQRRVHMVLVTDGETPKGIVTLDDVLSAVMGKPETVGPRSVHTDAPETSVI